MWTALIYNFTVVEERQVHLFFHIYLKPLLFCQLVADACVKKSSPSMFLAMLMVRANLRAIEYDKLAVFCNGCGHRDVMVARVGIGLLCWLSSPFLHFLWEVFGFSKQKRENKHMLWTTLLDSVRGTTEQNPPWLRSMVEKKSSFYPHWC